jgi:hypothetical protein
MARNPALTAAALLGATLAGGPLVAGDDVAVTLPARIDADRTLSGRLRLERDLEIGENVTLRILAGTTIAVSATDSAHAGDYPGRIEIHVRGRLVVEGTREAPVVLGAPADPPTAWQGIVLHADRMRAPDSDIRGLKIAGAAEAIVVTDGAPRIESSVFHTCTDAVVAAGAHDAKREIVERASRPEPQIEGCLFAMCRTGVFAELDAAPAAARCSFLGCEVALGNERHGTFTYPVVGVGPRAERCLFLRNSTAVLGCSVVEDSLFVTNDVALKLTSFHTTYSQEIDRLSWRRNVLWDNGLDCDGEADVGDDNARVDPGLVGERGIPTFAAASAPFAALALAETSPVRGTALDGGDPGPWGAAGRRGRGRTWDSLDRALRWVLVLGPPDKVDLAHPPKAAPSAAGERVGDAWWAAFPAGDDGAFHRASLRLPAAADTVIAAFAWTAADGDVPKQAEVNADGVVAPWCAGKPLAFPATNLRFGAQGMAAALAAGAPQALLVQWRSTDPDPRLGLALDCAVTQPAPGAAPAIDVEAVGFGPKNAGLRVRQPFHWGDLGRPGVLRVRFADGKVRDAADLGITLFDAKGTLRVDWPASAPKAGARFLVDGLRDPWGRAFGGQPVEVDAEPRK